MGTVVCVCVGGQLGRGGAQRRAACSLIKIPTQTEQHLSASLSALHGQAISLSSSREKRPTGRRQRWSYGGVRLYLPCAGSMLLACTCLLCVCPCCCHLSHTQPQEGLRVTAASASLTALAFVYCQCRKGQSSFLPSFFRPAYMTGVEPP